MPVLSRQALYDLVWKEPVRTVSASLGLSDTGLKKHCVAANIPVPDRGYWAKLNAGKAVVRVQLPLRAPGKAEFIQIGASSRPWPYDPVAELAQPLPEVPNFDEPLEDVHARVIKQVGKVLRVRDLSSPTAVVRKLIDADSKRRVKYQASSFSWDLPIFDSPFEQRRLRVLDALAAGLSRQSAKMDVTGKTGRDLRVKVGDQWLPFSLDHPAAKPDRWGEHQVQAGPVAPLKFELKPRWDEGVPRRVWADEEGSKLEDQLTEIVAAVLLTGEAEYRNLARAEHAWAIQRRAQNEAEIIKRRAEAEQRERERLEREAKERRDLLFSQAHAWRTAMDIRGFVGTAVEQGELDGSSSLKEWSDWALNEADLLDPVKQGVLLAPSDSTR